jgi:ubiquitin-protein ligase
MQELKEISRNSSSEIELQPNESDIHAWKAFIQVSSCGQRLQGFENVQSAYLTVRSQQQLHAETGLCVQGPRDTPFQGGVFELGIRVPEQYPLVPPAVHFRTKIFHPNVHFKVCRLCCRWPVPAHVGHLPNT